MKYQGNQLVSFTHALPSAGFLKDQQWFDQNLTINMVNLEVSRQKHGKWNKYWVFGWYMFVLCVVKATQVNIIVKGSIFCPPLSSLVKYSTPEKKTSHC